MYLSHLTLSDFRNYEQLDLALGPGLFLFYGDNAQGKTNLLEAVSMLATATSFHASSDREVVYWWAEAHVARLVGMLQRRTDTLELEATLFDPHPPVIAGEGHRPTRSIELPARVSHKRFKVNGLPRRTTDFIGQMRSVLFAPADLHLVDGSPEERRRFLDRALCQVQPSYCQALVKYRKIVTQRSALLKRVRENEEDPNMLNYLDEQLVLLANLIVFERKRMLTAISQSAQEFQQILSGGHEQLQVVYRPSLKIDDSWSVTDTPEHFRTQLRESRKKEIMQGVCLYGPHRDDIEFLVNGVNVLAYASRGQQRTVALAVKLAELTFMQTVTGDQPILLLDDVFSELDHARRSYLLHLMLQYEQVLLTATDLDYFPAEILQRAHRYRVTNGVVVAE